MNFVSSSGALAKPSRIVWLDIMRTLCAVQIVGFHWLRAVVKLQTTTLSTANSFVLQYRQLSWGLAGAHNFLISNSPALISRTVDNFTGLLFEFGWEAVHVFVLLSGFSLALTLARNKANPPWHAWILRRAERIVIPYYIISLPLVALMLGLSQLHGAGLFDILRKKLIQNEGGDLAGIGFAQIFLFDPHRRLCVPVFLSPAWWFVPAILVGYLLFPFFWYFFHRLGAKSLLVASFIVTVLGYCAIHYFHFLEWGWYFIVFNEAFNFSIGIVIGASYAKPDKATTIDAALRSNHLLAIGAILFCAGNICNLYLATYSISSSMFTVGLSICLCRLSIFLASTRISNCLSSIDSYLLYLLHQPFAFPIALILLRLNVPGAITFGLGVFLMLSAGMTFYVQHAMQRLARIGFNKKA